MPQERLPKQALLANLPQQIGENQLDDLELDVMEDREVWRLSLELLPP